MKRYGEYWKDKLSTWYTPGFEWIYDIVTGKVKDENKRYFPEQLTQFKDLQDITPMLHNKKTTSAATVYTPYRTFRSKYLVTHIDTVNHIILNPADPNSMQAVMDTYCVAHADSLMNTVSRDDTQLAHLKSNIDGFVKRIFSSDSNTLSTVYNDSKFWKLRSLPAFKGNFIEDKLSERKNNINIHEENNPQKQSKTPKILAFAAGVAALAAVALLALRGKKTNIPSVAFSGEPSNISNYHLNIVKSLKKFDIDVSPENLKSIMGADDFKEIIKSYSPVNFSLGSSKSKEPKEFFKNVIDGKFRVSLHSHSIFSDGRMTPQSFIDMAAKYADKVAQKLPKTDSRPPLLIALTDHDNFEGSQEIIKIIAKNPEKYKNLKFIAGAELSVKDGNNHFDNNHFDLTALGVNPFDENLTNYISNLKDKRANSARSFIDQVNKITGENLNLEELEKTDYKGKKTLQNRSGVVYIRNVMKVALNHVDKKHHDNIKNLFKEHNYSDRDIPDISFVIDNVKKAGGVLALTHPAKSFPNCDINWYRGFLQSLKGKGVSGIEANYQYTFGHHMEIANLEEINSVSRDFAKANNMFISGGTDSHKYDIFGHHHQIDDELLKTFVS